MRVLRLLGGACDKDLQRYPHSESQNQVLQGPRAALNGDISRISI